MPAKKSMAKKPAVKKAAPKAVSKAKVGAAAPKVATTPVNTPMTKGEMLQTIAASTGLTKKNVVSVIDGLGNLIERHIKKRGPGVFTLPGLIKIYLAKKPATKEREGVNPFTGEKITIKAKPARSVVRVKALKKLKEMSE